MASIIKRNNKHCVVYSFVAPDGSTKQKWETFDSITEAKKRKTEIEYEKQNGSFCVPNTQTVSELLKEYCEIYGVTNWAMSTYKSKIGLMNNYIIPLIGDYKLDEITPRMMDNFYLKLQKVKPVVVNNKVPKNKYLTPSTIREIHKFLRSAFNQAVKWELMARNPVLNASLPKEHKGTRDIWTAETLLHALEVCEDEILSLAINLSFACSLRIGEMLGLTWDCVTIDDESIRENNAQIFVNKELQRVDTETMHKLDNKEIIYVFPAIYNKGTTTLVLKTPKTFMSTRKVYLPLTVANMLKERKKQIEEAKKIYGDEYDDHNLVFCHPTGKPMEGQVINRALQKLIADHNLPKVVFHSFRHASITYKLKWNGGDMKSVQGDSGHSRMDMVAEVYSHIIDEDRRFNAQKFEEQFYQTKGLRNVEEGQTVPMPSFSSATELKKNETSETEELVTKLLNNPEALSLLKAIANKL